MIQSKQFVIRYGTSINIQFLGSTLQNQRKLVLTFKIIFLQVQKLSKRIWLTGCFVNYITRDRIWKNTKYIHPLSLSLSLILKI